MFDVSRASWISSAAHTAWTRAVDGASDVLLFACSVGSVGVGRDDGYRRMELIVVVVCLCCDCKEEQMQGCSNIKSRDEHSLSKSCSSKHQHLQHSQFSPQSPDVTLSTSDDDNNNTSRSDRPVVHAPPLSPPSTMRTSTFYSPSISSPTYWEAGHL